MRLLLLKWFKVVALSARILSVQYLLDGTHSYKLDTQLAGFTSSASAISGKHAMRCDAMHARQGKAMQEPYAESKGGAAACKVQVLAWRCAAFALGLDLLRERATSSKHRQLSLRLLHRTGTVSSHSQRWPRFCSIVRGTDALKEDRVDRPTGLRWVVNWPEGTWRSGTGDQCYLGTCAGT